MKFQRNIIQVGNTIGITIPKKVLDSLKLSLGDTIDVDINQTMQDEEKIISWRCPACEHIFDSSDDYPYCNICFSENLEEIK
jgi:hypothetical protein